MAHNPVVDPNRQTPKPQALPPAVRLHHVLKWVVSANPYRVPLKVAYCDGSRL
jgi:hypothetical protein